MPTFWKALYLPVPTNPSRALQKDHASISDNCWHSHCGSYWRVQATTSSQLTFYLLRLARIHPSNLSHFPMQFRDRLKSTCLLVVQLSLQPHSMNPAIQYICFFLKKNTFCMGAKMLGTQLCRASQHLTSPSVTCIYSLRNITGCLGLW